MFICYACINGEDQEGQDQEEQQCPKRGSFWSLQIRWVGLYYLHSEFHACAYSFSVEHSVDLFLMHMIHEIVEPCCLWIFLSWVMISIEVHFFWIMVFIVPCENLAVWHIPFLYSKTVDLLLMCSIPFYVMALWCVDKMKRTWTWWGQKSIRLCAQRPLEGKDPVPS